MPYSKSFRKQIIERCRSGESVSAVAGQSGMLRSTIYRWLKEKCCVEVAEQIYSPGDNKSLV